MIFVFDLDDTVCETDKYSEYYISKFIKEHKMPYKFVKPVCRYAEGKFDWDKETALKWYKTYGDQMMLEFPAKQGAIETINALFDNGHTIIIATARATDWHSQPEKITLDWLKNNNVKYNKIYLGRVDKEQICTDEKADFFIDDDIEITSRVLEHSVKGKSKCKPFIMNTAYNTTQTVKSGVTRVNSFTEFNNNLKQYGINLNIDLQK